MCAPRRARLARRHPAFPRLRRRAESAAARVPLRRSRGSRRRCWRASARASRPARVFAVGVSLGGSALLNWLGRAGESARRDRCARRQRCPRRSTSSAAGIAIGRGAQSHLHARTSCTTLKPEGARDGAALSRPARSRPRRARAHHVGVRRLRDRAAARLRRRRRLLDARVVEAWLAHDRACRRSCINARNDPFVPAASLPVAGRGVAATVMLEQPRARRSRRLHDRARAPGASTGCRGACSASSSTACNGRRQADRRVAGNRADRHDIRMNLPREIFKAYDIRGIVGKTLTPAVVRAVGQALGTRRAASAAATRSPSAATAACPARSCRQRWPTACARAGANVIDIGMVATPMTYFAASTSAPAAASMVTGSHNPPDYNGLKMVVAGTTLSGDDIQAICAADRARPISRRAAATYAHAGHRRPPTSTRIVGDVKLARPMKIAVDCGNGVAGAFAPTLFRKHGLRGGRALLRRRRPLSQPPSRPVAAEEPRRPRRSASSRATASSASRSTATATASAWSRRTGHIIYPDRQLMLFAADVLSRVPGATIIYDVKSTRNLEAVDHAATAASRCCGRPATR